MSGEATVSRAAAKAADSGEAVSGEAAVRRAGAKAAESGETAAAGAAAKAAASGAMAASRGYTTAASGEAAAPLAEANAAVSDETAVAGGAWPAADSSAAPRGGEARAAAVSGEGGLRGRGPRLLATRDPCAGYFPGSAAANRGEVQLSVDVDAHGIAHPGQTLSELPRAQGFERAAKACAAHLHFAPALNAQGQPVAGRARIALKFDRS